MRTYVIRGLCVLAVVLAVAAPAAAQGVLRGKVSDAAGKPIEGATVLIEGQANSRRAEVKTNRNGEFIQVGLASGRYNVTVTKDNMKTSVQTTVSQGKQMEIAVALAPTSGLSSEQEASNAAVQLLATQAVDALRAGRNDEAIQKFTEIVGKVPTCGECYTNLGVAYKNKGQFAEAETALLKATELSPNSADAWTNLANVYNSQKKFEQAQTAGAKAAELSAAGGAGGGNAEAQYNQGVILWNSGKFAEAKAQFEAAVKADPNMGMAHYQLGMANLNLGQIPEARKAFEGYLKADPNGEKAAEVQGFLKQLPQ